MKKLWFFVGLHLVGAIALILIVTGAGRAQPVTPSTAPAPTSAQPVQSPRPPYIAPPAPIQSHCEAANLAWLIGKPRTAIPVPVDLSNRRVSCTTCPVTQDYVPERTDILFDAQTGLITAVKCG